MVYTVAFLGYALGQFTSPAEHAILPQLVGRERLVWANGLLTVSGSIVSLVGPAIGGFLLGAAGFSTVVLVNVISFALAAALVALMSAIPPAYAHSRKIDGTLRSQLVTPWHEWLDGLRYVHRERGLKLIFVLSAIIMVADGVFNSLWAVWAKSDLDATSFQFGLLGTALGAGILLGGVAYVRLGNTFSTHVIWTSALLTGGLLIATFNLPILWLAITFTAIRGVLAVGFYTGATTLLQQRAPDAYVGRILGSFSTVKAMMLLVGSTLAIMATHISVVVMLNAAGVVWIIAGLTALVLQKRGRSGNKSPSRR